MIEIKPFIVLWLPLLLSVITLYMKLAAGDKKPWAWSLGVANQVLWCVWILMSGSWLLLPMNIGLFIIYVRNHFKWNPKPAPDAQDRDLIKGM